MAAKVLKSMSEPVLQEFSLLARLREHRANRNQVVACGTKLVQDLAAQGHIFHDILHAAKDPPPHEIKNMGSFYPVGTDSLRRVSQMHDFNGLIGKLNKPEATLEDQPFPRLVVALDVRDIGAVGTLLRSALAFQWHGVWIIRDSVDIFEPRILRSALGAQFNLPFRIRSFHTLLQYCEQHKLTLAYPSEKDNDDGEGARKLAEAKSVCLLFRDAKSEIIMPKTSVGIKVSNPALDFSVFAASALYEVKHRWFADVPRSAAVVQ